MGSFQMVTVYGHLHRSGEVIDLGQYASAFVRSGPDGFDVVVQPGNRQLLTQETHPDGGHKAWREHRAGGRGGQRDGQLFEHFEISTAPLR